MTSLAGVRIVTKMVGAAEFKAKCLKIIDDLQKDREPVTITKRGKVVATLQPAIDPPKKLIGLLKSDLYRFDVDPSEPAVDPDDWNALR